MDSGCCSYENNSIDFGITGSGSIPDPRTILYNMNDVEIDKDFDEYIWEQCLKCVDIEYKLGIPIIQVTNQDFFDVFIDMFAIITSKPQINDMYVYLQDKLGNILIVKSETEVLLYMGSATRHLAIDLSVDVISPTEYHKNQENYWVEYKDNDRYIVTLV